MKKLAIVLFAAAWSVSGCSTMEGFGKDVSKLGDVIAGEAAPQQVQYVEPQVQAVPQQAPASVATKVEDTRQQAQQVQQNAQQVTQNKGKGWF